MSSINTESNVPFEVTANSATAQRVCGLLTNPVKQADISRLKGQPITLTTSSHHQGWVTYPDQGSWSWFELAIIPGYAPVGKPDEVHYDAVKNAGKPLSWIAFEHPVNQSGQYETFTRQFPGDHELWKYVQDGDRFAVFGCAQYPRWACYGRQVKFEVAITPGPGTQPQTASGTVTQSSGNRILFVFDVNGFSKMFDTTLTPALPPFSSEGATIEYTDGAIFFGTYSFTGYVGKSDYRITLVDDKNATIATITGNLDSDLKQRNQIRGTGVWMSS